MTWQTADPAPPIGWCEGCGEPILDHQPWVEGSEHPGLDGWWHVDCLPEGGDPE